MRYLLAILLLTIPTQSMAQTPVGDYPGIILYLVADGTAPNKPSSTFRLLAPSEITCQLENTAAPTGALASSYFINWADPLNVGLFCQVDATLYVQQLPPGMWYASLTFVLPAAKWDPCPEMATTGACLPKTLDGRLYPTYNIQGHETPAFAVGVFLKPPTNLLVIKAND
jgi:hypothetical protein